MTRVDYVYRIVGGMGNIERSRFDVDRSMIEPAWFLVCGQFYVSNVFEAEGEPYLAGWATLYSRFCVP